MNKNQFETLKGARPKFELSISQTSLASWSDGRLPIQIIVSNVSDSSGEFYRSSLLGLTINGIGNTYNLNLHFEYIPRDRVEIPPHEHDTFTMNLRDVWQEPTPQPGRYRVIMRYEIEGNIYTSNELTIHLVR